MSSVIDKMRDEQTREAARRLVGAAGLVSLFWLGRSRGAVEFGEKNAVDVEAIGLYWHFVDLVWVFVFTFFYLL